MSTVIQPLHGIAGQDGGRFEREALVHVDRLYAGALQLTSGQVAAEELVQRTFERAFRDFHWALPEATVPVWLYRHLVSTWFDEEPHRRSPRRSSSIAAGTADEVVLGAMHALAPAVRITLYLADVEGFSSRQIAEITEVPTGIVESRMRRAHRQLANSLEAWLRQDHPAYAAHRAGPHRP
jgi:RNA polymerase sigma-70 factor (ECF subfamily)